MSNSRPAFGQTARREEHERYDPRCEFSKHSKNKDKRIKELLTSTAHTSSSNQAFWCHRSDHCGEPSLITIISYISLCFLSFSGILNRKYMETPTLETFCSCWCTHELTTLFLGNVVHLCALDYEFSLAFTVLKTCKIGTMVSKCNSNHCITECFLLPFTEALLFLFKVTLHYSFLTGRPFRLEIHCTAYCSQATPKTWNLSLHKLGLRFEK